MPEFKLGDKVRTAFIPGEEYIVRKVVGITKYSETMTYISADGGAPCPTCHRPAGKALSVVSGLFTKVNDNEHL